MHFAQLPLILAQEVLRIVVLSGDINDVIALRLVNHLFNVEILRGVGGERIHDIDRSFCRKNVYHGKGRQLPHSLTSRLLFEYITSRSYTRSRFAGWVSDIVSRLHRLLDNEDNGPSKPGSITVSLYTVCEVLTQVNNFGEIADLVANDEAFDDSQPESVLTAQHIFAVAAAIPLPQIYEGMLDTGFNPAFSSEYFGSPLRVAVVCGNAGLVKTLLRHAATNRGEFTTHLQEAFEIAANRGRDDMIQHFLQDECRVSQNSEACTKATLRAIGSNQHETAQMILRPTLKLSRDDRTYICVKAAAYGALRLLRNQMRKNVDPTFVLATALFDGLEGSTSETVQFLLDKGAYIRHKYKCYPIGDCFQYACRRGYTEVVRLFLRNGVNLKTDYTEFNDKFQNFTRVEVLQLLDDHGLDFTTEKARECMESKLIIAMGEGRQDVVQWLLAKLSN